MPNPVSYFVALLPPPALQNEITAIKQEIWQRFGSRAALKSPPHITLQPPFQWPAERQGELEQALASFAAGRSPIPVHLQNFAAFAPRVIYIDVVRGAELMALQPALIAHLEATCGIADPVAKGRPQFIPHVTVGFRDLTTAAFHAAWAEFQDRPFAAEFMVPALTLLRYDGQRWQVVAEFQLPGPSP
jgi:2'-5' RNA ligase